MVALATVSPPKTHRDENEGVFHNERMEAVSHPVYERLGLRGVTAARRLEMLSDRLKN